MEKYHVLLKKYIESSGLSLTEIGEKLRERGYQTDKSYLSRLKNNRTLPASEELNKAIAEITGNDPNMLNFAASFERSPEILKEYVEDAYQLEKSLDSEIALSLSEDASFLLGKNKVTDFLKCRGIEYTFEDFDFTYIYNLPMQDKWELVNLLTSKTVILKHPFIGEFNPLHFSPIKILLAKDKNIPMFRNIYGEGLYLREDYLGYIKDDILTKNTTGLICIELPDNSLLDISVAPGSRAFVHLTTEFDAENIFLVSYQDSPAKFRKIQRYNDLLILKPLNHKMDVEIIESNRANIIGRLIEVKMSKLLSN